MSEELVWLLPQKAVDPLFTARRFWTEPDCLAHALTALGGATSAVREKAERSEASKQVVSYAVLRTRDCVLSLRRSPLASGELRNRLALLFGGHVDGHEPATVDGLHTALLRELDEEFGSVPLARTPALLGVVADPYTAVGRRHLAFVFEVWLAADSILLESRYDNAEYLGQDLRHALTPIGTLLQMSREEFDPWSQAVLDWFSSTGPANGSR